jgi:hypothetical protein
MKGKSKGMAMGHIPILAHGTHVEHSQWKGPRLQSQPVHQAPLNATFKKPKSFAKP